MKPAYFDQCSWCIDIDKNNYPEETAWDINPSLTLAQTLTLSTGELSFGHFASSRCHGTTIFNFAYMNSLYNLGWIHSLYQKSISHEKLQWHEIDA